MDTTKNFDGYAKDYTAGRPNYATQLIDGIFNNYGLSGNSVIADKRCFDKFCFIKKK